MFHKLVVEFPSSPTVCQELRDYGYIRTTFLLDIEKIALKLAEYNTWFDKIADQFDKWFEGDFQFANLVVVETTSPKPQEIRMCENFFEFAAYDVDDRTLALGLMPCDGEEADDFYRACGLSEKDSQAMNFEDRSFMIIFLDSVTSRAVIIVPTQGDAWEGKPRDISREFRDRLIRMARQELLRPTA